MNSCRSRRPDDCGDLSGLERSTKGLLGSITNAAHTFIDLFGPDDKGMIFAFDNGVHVMTELTADRKKLKRAIGNVFPADQAGSDMNDAVDKVISKYFKDVKGKKAIIVLTDGVVAGKVREERVKQLLVESDVVFYPIFFQSEQVRRLLKTSKKTISYSELVQMFPVNYIYSLSVASGGRLFAADGDDFSTAFQDIAAERGCQRYSDRGKPSRRDGQN